MILKKRGVDIHTGAKVMEIRKTSDGLACVFEEKDAICQVSSEGVLVATGRKANVDELFADGLSADVSAATEEDGLIRLDHGCIVANEHFETDVKGVYAIGDVTGRIQLAHAATAQGSHAISHMFQEKELPNLSLIPSCVYTSPEIAAVGLGEEEAKSMRLEVITGKYLMSANGKSVLSGQERGFIKLVADKCGKLLGAHLMCARATDMIGMLELAIQEGMSAEQVASVILPHPTFGEGIGDAAMELLRKI